MRRHIALLALLLALLLTALLTGAAPWVQAQVAVPELVPAAVRVLNSRFPINATNSLVNPMSSIVPENPAALQWGAPSRIGGGVLQGDKRDIVDGDSTHYRGSFAGFRWVKQRVALAADTLDYSVDMEKPVGSPAHLERKEQAVALSFSLPEWLAWGVGSRSLTAREGGPSATRVDSSGWNFGLSLRLGQILFVGAGLGHETASANLPPPPPPAPAIPFVGDIERDVRMVGIGLRGTGSLVWHLEADSIHRDPFQDGGGVPRLPGHDLTLYVGEVQFGNWLLGYSNYSAKDLQPIGFQVSGYTVDFGLAPFSGLTLTGRSELTHQVAGSLQTSSERINSVALMWQF